METKLLSTGQVAELLGLKIHRLQYHFVNGDLPDVSRIGEKRAFSKEDVRAVAAFFGLNIDETRFARAFEGRRANV